MIRSVTIASLALVSVSTIACSAILDFEKNRGATAGNDAVGQGGGGANGTNTGGRGQVISGAGNAGERAAISQSGVAGQGVSSSAGGTPNTDGSGWMVTQAGSTQGGFSYQNGGALSPVGGGGFGGGVSNASGTAGRNTAGERAGGGAGGRGTTSGAGNGVAGHAGTARGGIATGGAATGGAATGGAATGGVATGGAATGGAATGGAATGGAATGGVATGGVATGGVATGGGPVVGTIGGPGSSDQDYQRAKILKEGREYVIQNNNYGNPSGTDQTLTFADNSFRIVSTTGSGPGGGLAAAFPSIYIGNNGNTSNGMNTTATDGLPKQISTIQSVNTSYKWTGSCGSGFNASYDVWFSASKPTTAYADAISGFVMVWLCDPSDAQPIGNGGVAKRTATVAGKSWDVWVGPRGGSGANSGAPVVSYVAKPSLNSFSFDLLEFIKDAAADGISSSWYLTDVFGGFEIWNGGSTNGLSLDEFTCVVE